MEQILTRLYATAGDAERVVTALRDYGVRSDDIHLTRPGADAAATEASILKAHVLRKHVPTYAAGVARGGTLVSVNAVFGHGMAVLHILDKGNPIDDGMPKAAVRTVPAGNPAPLSDMLGIPVLIKEPPRSLGLPLLSGGNGPYRPAIPLPTLSGTSGPYRGVVPMPLLSGNGPTIPIATLTDTNGGYRPAIPLPMLIK